MEERFETFTVLIAKIGRSIRRIKAEEMAEYDLKATHVNCLYYLYMAGELTAAELCERCDEDKAAISRSLDSLERGGYLQPQAGKKYKSKLLLTDLGRQTGEEVSGRIERILLSAGAGLTEQERQIMYGALEKISVNLEKIEKEL